MYLLYKDKDKAQSNLDKIFQNMQKIGDITYSESWDILSKDINGMWYFNKPDINNSKNFDYKKLMIDIEFDFELEKIVLLKEYK